MKSLNVKEIWNISSVDYVKAIIKNIEVRLMKEGMKLPVRVETLMSSDYKPELDATAELEPYGITMCRELMGKLRWEIEIVRLDILHEVSVISSCQSSPCDGHLQKILHIFALLKMNPKLTLYFDPNIAIIDPTSFIGSTAKEICN